MFNNHIIQALKNNWGDRAHSLDCYAQVKLIDPLSSWCCYLFAMDENEEYVECLFYTNLMGIDIQTMRLSSITSMYNEEGMNPIIDEEFRKTKITTLIKRLRNET